MATVTVGLPAIVLTTVGTPSTGNAIPVAEDVYALSIIAPGAMTSTVTVYVEQTSSGTNYTVLQSGGADVTVSAAKAIVISPFPFKQITLVSGAQEASPRTFTLAKVFVT